MANLKRKCIIILCVAYLVGMGFYLPIISVSAYPTYPQTGIIAMWNGSSIPTGWEVVTAANNRFVMGTSTGEIPGVLGGTSSHSHIYTDIPIHNHGYTSTLSATHSHSYTGGGSTANKGTSGSDIRTLYPDSQSTIGGSISNHVHTVNPTGYSICYTEVTGNVYPPFQTVTYIKKVSATAVYPAGLIVISTGGTIPSGWVRCDGSNGTPDLRGDFLMGSLSPGSTGGSTSHNHMYTQVPYHTHSMQSDGGVHYHSAYQSTMYVQADTWATFAYDVVVAALSESSTVHISHSHSVPTVGSSPCYTQSSLHIPYYTAVDFLMNTQDTASLPVGVVALWDGAASSIPYGWAASDGTYGTIDLRNRFVRGRVSEAIGTTGGSSSHTHTYTTVPQHAHSISPGDAYHTHQMYEYGGLAAGAETLLGLGSTVYVEAGSRTTTSTSYSHHHYINSAGVSNPNTQSASNNPPYIKLTYIKCIDYEADAPNFISTPNDRALEYGYTSESITWTVTDSHPDTYTINLLGSGMVVPPTYWGSGSPITYFIPNGFGVGSYTYQIELLDKYGRPSTDSVTLTVQDTTNPILTQVPTPLTVELGYTGQSFSWTATDLNPSTYSIELIGDEIVVGPTAWTSGNSVVYNIPDGFGPGTYTYEITYLDLYANPVSDDVSFSVQDTTTPTIVSAPSDVVIELGDTGPFLSWDVTDPYPGTYSIDVDGVPLVTDVVWSSGTPIEYDTDPLSLGVGIYGYTLNVSDVFGNFILNSTTVTVEDTIAPVIESEPSDIVVEYGYTDQEVAWEVSDLDPGSFIIELTGTGIVDSGSWTELLDIIPYSVPDGFGVGEYIYTLNVSDASGNFVTESVTFTVEDTTNPIISESPYDVVVNEGYLNRLISWTATDPYPDTYTIELEGSGIVVDHTTWTSGIPVTYTIPEGFSAGTYTYIITFYDEEGNSVSESVLFTVRELPHPTIPGFSVPLMFFVSVCAVMTTVLIVKKKVRNLI
jgi:microcystin-dependent protein